MINQIFKHLGELKKMNIKLVIIGNIFAISAKEYKEEKNVYVQFLNKTESGGAEIIKVKMTDKADIAALKENASVRIPVKVSSYNNALYYTQAEAMLK